jgi:hypothetical protein
MLVVNNKSVVENQAFFRNFFASTSSPDTNVLSYESTGNAVFTLRNGPKVRLLHKNNSANGFDFVAFIVKSCRA